MHWVRYQLLPEGEDQDDLRDCLRWSAVLLRVAPQLVPEPVRAYLEAASGSANATGELDDRGGSLYAAYQRTGDLQVLEAAITALREAVDATPAHDADRPNRLGNLGLALWTRFGRIGQLADLERAITAFDEAADAVPADDPDRPAMLATIAVMLAARSAIPASWRTWTRPSHCSGNLSGQPLAVIRSGLSTCPTLALPFTAGSGIPSSSRT